MGSIHMAWYIVQGISSKSSSYQLKWLDRIRQISDAFTCNGMFWIYRMLRCRIRLRSTLVFFLWRIVPMLSCKYYWIQPAAYLCKLRRNCDIYIRMLAMRNCLLRNILNILGSIARLRVFTPKIKNFLRKLSASCVQESEFLMIFSYHFSYHFPRPCPGSVQWYPCRRSTTISLRRNIWKCTLIVI